MQETINKCTLIHAGKHTNYKFKNPLDLANKIFLFTRFREFTLKESFWFALTSFTPQGGGEAPKALSSRTLVAAYWLFVVLMLATFTANLAAFLTVERMQVSSIVTFNNNQNDFSFLTL